MNCKGHMTYGAAILPAGFRENYIYPFFHVSNCRFLKPGISCQIIKPRHVKKFSLYKLLFSPFLNFSQKMRRKLIRENPNFSTGKLMSLISEMWKNLPEEEKRTQARDNDMDYIE